MEARLHASKTLKVRRLRFRGGMHASRNLHPARHFQCFFVSRSSLRRPLGESELPSSIKRWTEEGEHASRSLARYRSDDERPNGTTDYSTRGSRSTPIGRSVGRWASVLLASSSGDTNRAGNYVTMPRPNLAATWPPMNTVWEYFITLHRLLEIPGGREGGQVQLVSFFPPPPPPRNSLDIDPIYSSSVISSTGLRFDGERGGGRKVALSFLFERLLFLARASSTTSYEAR